MMYLQKTISYTMGMSVVQELLSQNLSDRFFVHQESTLYFDFILHDTKNKELIVVWCNVNKEKLT